MTMKDEEISEIPYQICFALLNHEIAIAIFEDGQLMPETE